MVRVLYFGIFTLFLSISLHSQGDIIHLQNPSFEGIPIRGGASNLFLAGWRDCAKFYFPNETPPDIHGNNTNLFSVNHVPQDGSTFLGMVARELSESWEMVTQKLESNLVAGRCYQFKIHLAKADIYLSKVSKKDRNKYNFNKPLKLRIWGSSMSCKKTQLLAESPMVNHKEWREYSFKFKPKDDYSFIMFEVFYKTPVLIPYNGNMLIDNASDIVEVECPEEDNLLAFVDINEPVNKTLEQNKQIVLKSKPKPQKNKVNTNKNIKEEPKKILKVEPKPEKEIVAPPKKNKVKEQSKHRPKILKELNGDNIKKGQIIAIEKLYFKADSSNFMSGSELVLDEIYIFLEENPKVIIEIGGHTNSIPREDYCNYLSTERAKTVANYLYSKGIPKYRIKFKGYGKSKPIASNSSRLGRKKNQRVEIKILSTGL